MDIRMYWFSGTGNTRAIVEAMAERLPPGGAHVKPMMEADSSDAAGADRVVLAFPVYAFGLPVAVAEFAKRLEIPEEALVYSIATYAGLAGGPHHELRYLLRQRNRRLTGSWTLKMPENYPVMKPPPPEDKQKKLFREAEARLGDVASAIEGGVEGGLADTPPPVCWLAPPLHRLGVRKFRTLDAKFHVEEQCTSCATCEKVCPVNNIRMDNGRPTWLHHCEQCFACVQWCPVEAIEWNGRTQGKPRYHHPRYAAHDFFLNNDDTDES